MTSGIKNLKINLNKDDQGSFGFSLLGKFEGIPHVIYDVISDSPAADEKVSYSMQKNFQFFCFFSVYNF